MKRALCRWCPHWSPCLASGGHRVARFLLEENFSGLWAVEIVEEVGLVTCERSVIGQIDRLLIGRHRGSCSEEIHMEEEKVEVKVQGEEVEVENRERQWREQSEDRRENRQSLRRMTHGWYDAHKHLEPMSCETLSWVRTNTIKCDVWGCSVHKNRRKRGRRNIQQRHDQWWNDFSSAQITPHRTNACTFSRCGRHILALLIQCTHWLKMFERCCLSSSWEAEPGCSRDAMVEWVTLAPAVLQLFAAMLRLLPGPPSERAALP